MQVTWKAQSFSMSLKLAARRVWFIRTTKLTLAIVSGPIAAMSLNLNRRGMPKWVWCRQVRLRKSKHRDTTSPTHLSAGKRHLSPHAQNHPGQEHAFHVRAFCRPCFGSVWQSIRIFLLDHRGKSGSGESENRRLTIKTLLELSVYSCSFDWFFFSMRTVTGNFPQQDTLWWGQSLLGREEDVHE